MTSTIQNSATEKVLSPSVLAHVVLRTNPSNFSKMVSFYKTFLGAHATYENDTLSFLTYDQLDHRVAIAAVPGTTAKNPSMGGMDHFAFSFENLRGLTQAYQQRKSHGILPFWCVNHGPTMSMYYLDPDGNKIETQVDIFDDPQEAIAFFEGEEFATNPFGVDFDPEVLIQRLNDGEDEALLMRRANIGHRGLDSVPFPTAPESVALDR